MKQQGANNKFDISQAEREKKKSLLEKLEAKKAEQAKVEAQEAERKKKKEVLDKIEKMKTEDAQATEQSAAKASSEIEYIVKPGDTLSKIAQAHGVKWQEIAEYNKLANPDLIYPDQVIKIKK